MPQRYSIWVLLLLYMFFSYTLSFQTHLRSVIYRIQLINNPSTIRSISSTSKSTSNRDNTAIGMVSKHLVAQAVKSGETTKEEKIIDQKKLQLIAKLGLEDLVDDTIIDTMKTGAQLRKDRKHDLKMKLKNEKHLLEKARGKLKKIVPEKIRFRLGNGIESLSPDSLIGLVKSTAPYLYPETAERMIIEEDDGISTENDGISMGNEGISKGNAGISGDIHSIHSTTSSSGIIGKNVRLSTLSKGPSGWKAILQSSNSLKPSSPISEADRVDYFTLCLAAHFATVATYVPTDVDSKIRGHCWNDPSVEVLHEQFKVLCNALEWNVEEVSRKSLVLPHIQNVVSNMYDVIRHHPYQSTTHTIHNNNNNINNINNNIDNISMNIEQDNSDVYISGHNGEWLGVLCGAWGGFLRVHDYTTAQYIQTIIHNELLRESQIFKYYTQCKSSIENDTILLKISAIITHNVGDIDQGLSYWDESISKKYSTQFELFGRLAHDRSDRFDGQFIKAKAIYKELLSAEGHRNYPLREPKCLRRSPEFMLPLGPWYERWGRLIAMHPGLSEEERYQVFYRAPCDTNMCYAFLSM